MSEPKAQELDAKIQEYRAVVAQDPGSPLFVPLAQAHLSAGRPAEALEVCRSGLAFLPDLAPGRLVLAKTLCRLGRLREAEAELAALVALAPDLEEAQDLLTQLRAGQLVTLDSIRPQTSKAPPVAIPEVDEDEEHTRGHMRPAQSAESSFVEDVVLEEELAEEEEDEEEDRGEKTIGQGYSLPEGLREEEPEEAMEGQETVQGKPAVRSQIIQPPPKLASGNFSAVFDEDENEEEEGDATRPLIDMQNHPEARLTWQERSKLIQGGMGDLFGPEPGKEKRESSRSAILTPEHRKAFAPAPAPSPNALGSPNELLTTELRKSGEHSPSAFSELKSLVEPKRKSSEMNLAAELRKSAELRPPGEMKSSPEVAALGMLANQPPMLKRSSEQNIPVVQPPEPAAPPKKSRTQLVPRVTKSPFMSPVEEVKGALHPTAPADPSSAPSQEARSEQSVNAPLTPLQKFSTAPLVPALKHKPIIELLDGAPVHHEEASPAPPAQPPSEGANTPKKSPSGSQNGLQAFKKPTPPRLPTSQVPGDFFGPPPVLPSAPPKPDPLLSMGLSLGPQEVPILPPEPKPKKTLWPWLFALAGAVIVALVVVLFLEKGRKREEAEALFAAADELLAEGSAAGLSSASQSLEKAALLVPDSNDLLRRVALVEGLRSLVFQEERTDRLGEALAKAKNNSFSDDNIAFGQAALSAQANPKEAIAQLQSARGRFPQSGLLAFAEGFLQADTGAFEVATQNLKASLTLSPDFSWARLSLAEVYAMQNAPELGALLERELEAHPGNVRAQSLALLRNIQSPKLPKETQLSEQVRRALGPALARREAEWARLSLARQAYLSGDESACDKHTEPFVKAPPRSALVGLLLSEVFLARGQYTPARETLLSLSKVLPEALWVTPLVEASFGAGRFIEATPLMAKLPPGPYTNYLNGRLLLLQKEPQKAIEMFGAAYQADKSLVVAMLFAIEAALSQPSVSSAALEKLSAQLKALPAPVETRTLPAPFPRALPVLLQMKILQAQGKQQDAQEAYARARSLAPRDETVAAQPAP